VAAIGAAGPFFTRSAKRTGASLIPSHAFDIFDANNKKYMDIISILHGVPACAKVRYRDVLK
jgi:hypothetical protein